MPDSRSDDPTRPSWKNVGDRLDSWKEIAVYMQRTVSTVRRWEKGENLPIHRHIHNKQASVYAYRSEIDNWLDNRGRVLENDRPGWFRFFPESPKTAAGVAGGVTLFLLVGLVAWMDIDSSPDPEGLSFQQRDWVLIADFENRTGEAVFDGVLESALRREIANSQFVNVVPRERIEDTLRLMRKPLDTRIDREVAREISQRDGGIKALLTGRVEKLDSTYLLSIELVDPSAGQTIAATSEEADGQSEVLTTLRALSRWSRETLGEKLTDIQASEEQLEKVTTPSLRALQLFTKADALIAQGRSDLSEELLKQAVEIDPEFASAHMHLAHAIRNQRKPAEEYLPHAEQAFQLADTAGDRERYFIQGSYYGMKGEQERAVHSYETLLTLYPDHFWAANNLSTHYRRTGRLQLALPLELQRAELRPTNLSSQLTAASTLIQLDGDLIRARPYLDRSRSLLTPETIREWNMPAIRTLLLPAYEAWARGDPQTALVEIDSVLQMFKRLGMSNHRVPALGTLYSALGKRQLARQWLTNNLDRKNQQWSLAILAFTEGDDEAMKNHLTQFLSLRSSSGTGGTSTPLPTGPRLAAILAQLGFLSEAEKLLVQLENSPSSGSVADPTGVYTKLARGVLALRTGNSRESIPLIEDALGNGPSVYNVSKALAEAWYQEGQLQKAVQVLEEASNKQYLALAPHSNVSPLMWLRVRLALAKLYREAGRNEEAREIEEDLRKHLALADPDHPILRQLERTEQVASRQATN